MQVIAAHSVFLWPGDAPGSHGNAEIDRPSLTIYPASPPNSIPTGVVICPGAGYCQLRLEQEGRQVAEWLNALGISAFVLKYRLSPKYHYPIQLWDAQRAIRYIRANAAELAVDPARIGIWGFSAGGHLASLAGTHFDPGHAAAPDPLERQSSRPDFMILAYPLITLEEPYAHVGSRSNLLGDKPNLALIQALSTHRHVSAKTAPAFLFHTSGDQTMPVENSVYFYLALHRARVPAEMHLYSKGDHGVGLAQDDPVLRTWTDRLLEWLKLQGLTAPRA